MSDTTPSSTSGDDDVIAAASDGAYTLIVADFADTDTAWEAYEALKSVEDGSTVAIDGVVVVKRDADGKLEIQKATDHSTRSGLKWGVVGGVALGVIFPPSILGSAAALGAAGAATGKIRQLHHRSELADQLEDSIAPVTPASSRWSPTLVSWRSARPSRQRTPSSRARSTRPSPRTSRRRPRRPRTRRRRAPPSVSVLAPGHPSGEFRGGGVARAAWAPSSPNTHATPTPSTVSLMRSQKRLEASSGWL